MRANANYKVENNTQAHSADSGVVWIRDGSREDFHISSCARCMCTCTPPQRRSLAGRHKDNVENPRDELTANFGFAVMLTNMEAAVFRRG